MMLVKKAVVTIRFDTLGGVMNVINSTATGNIKIGEITAKNGETIRLGTYIPLHKSIWGDDVLIKLNCGDVSRGFDEKHLMFVGRVSICA